MGRMRGLVHGARWLTTLAIVGLVAAMLILDGGDAPRPAARTGPAATVVRPILASVSARPRILTPRVIPAVDLPVPALPPIDIGPPDDCGAAAFAAAGRANAASLTALAWSPFHRPETGWAIYAPSVGREIGAACGPATGRFAAAMARWQTAHRQRASGVLDEAAFAVMRDQWALARPFVRLTRGGACPPGPFAFDLAMARAEEGYAGKAIQLTPGALAAYRRMVAAARAETREIAADPRLLAIFSGYRSPEADAARCARDGDCDTVARATCSAHRTGEAIDLALDGSPGHRPDSTADADRLRLVGSPAYLWLIARAGAFGFVNYPFEPWHWEWTGRD